MSYQHQKHPANIFTKTDDRLPLIAACNRLLLAAVSAHPLNIHFSSFFPIGYPLRPQQQ